MRVQLGAVAPSPPCRPIARGASVFGLTGPVLRPSFRPVLARNRLESASRGAGSFTLKKLECSKQALRLRAQPDSPDLSSAAIGQSICPHGLIYRTYLDLLDGAGGPQKTRFEGRVSKALASGVLATLEDESFFISKKFHFQPVALHLADFSSLPTSNPGPTSLACECRMSVRAFERSPVRPFARRLARRCRAQA